jgi:hypothetical protein
LWRTQLDVSGETWALGHTGSCEVSLFDSLHNPKPFYPINSPVTDCGPFFFSENLFDTDPDIEVLLHWLDASQGLEQGNVLLGLSNEPVYLAQSTYYLSQLPGLPPKLMSGPYVFNVPDLQMEHNYGSSNFNVQRLLLPVDGERYVAHRYQSFNGFHFYDGNHQLVQVVNLSYPGFEYLSHVSQDYFKADDLLEFFGVRWVGGTDANGNHRSADVVQEDGTLLFSMPCEQAILSQLPGLPDRLLVRGFSGPEMWQTTVVDPASLLVLHTFEGRAERKVLPDGNEVYYDLHATGKILIYNALYQLTKSIDLPSGFNKTVTRGQFSAGNKFEVLYTTFDPDAQYQTQCIDEDGNLLYVFPGAQIGRIDQQAGLRNKLIVRYFSNQVDSTRVYDFTGTTSTGSAAALSGVQARPNLFRQSFELNFPAVGDYRVRLFSPLGALVYERFFTLTSNTQVEVGTLPAAVYWLTVESGGRRYATRVVKTN